MNEPNQQQWPVDKNNAKDKLLKILNESQNILKQIQNSVEQSKKFNKRARSFLTSPTKFISPDPAENTIKSSDTMKSPEEKTP